MEHDSNPDQLLPQEWNDNATFTSSFCYRAKTALKELRGTFGAKEFYYPALLSLTAVGLIGLAEGLLISKGPHAVEFSARYALENIAPSIIWLTQNPKLIAETMGLNPETILRTFGSSVRDANVQLLINDLVYARSILAGFIGVGYVVRAATALNEVKQSIKDRVSKGKAPFPKEPNGKVIRLAGKQSDVTDYSLSPDIDGAHLLPVYEDAGSMGQLVDRFSVNNTPVAWCVEPNKYGKNESWKGFSFYPSWLLKDKKGNKILYMEADASTGEQALALGPENANDLSIQETAQGFRKIKQIAQDGGADFDQSMRVLLASTQQKLVTGGGNIWTLRQQIEQQHEADIIIDSQAPLVEAICSWLKTSLSDDPEKEKNVIFDTTNREYFATIKSVLERLGYTVLDKLDKAASNKIPRLVYQDTTADTAQTVISLIESQLVSPQLCCALLDRSQGLEDLKAIEQETGETIPSVCSSVVYDKWFRIVRQLVLNGQSKEQIQYILDNQFNKYLHN
ncbi:hypothetical protein KC726_01400 [Candidatus Woesebacteria bacterium]|nr:hypothetical protein [Candidatus Woesebacteria bacterium]